MKNLFHILSLVIALLLFGCIAEDDVFNDDFSEDSEVVETPLIVSFLNEEYTRATNNNVQNCFSITFPVKITYNTGQSITIANNDGMEQATKSQSSTFHINSLVFPITVSIENQEVIIRNTIDFNSLFETCEIPSLKDTILENIGTCFDFKYPISVFNASQSEQLVESKNDLIEFIENQDNNYVLEFKFPLNDIQNTVINSYFDLYEITNSCNSESCPEISFTKNLISNDGLTYKFSATGATESKYSWYINDEFIQTGLEGDKDQFLTYEFTENGTYRICVAIETPGCATGTEYCEDLIIDDIEEITCILDFETIFVQTDDTSIQKVVFEGFGSVSNTEVTYLWEINDVQQNENSDRLEYIFTENGTYQICIFTETPECPNGVEFCEDVIIDNIVETRPVFNIIVDNPVQDPTNCNFDLIYEYVVSNGNENKYLLEANAFDQNLTDGDYSWYINNDFINTGKVFEYEFIDVGEYTICVKVETPECPNGTSFCRDFTIEPVTVN